MIERPFIGLSVCVLAIGTAVSVPAGAEIVVLDNGRFLKAASFEVEGEKARVGLATGGELVMPMVRIDRVLDDEIGGDVATTAGAEGEVPAFLYLGFAEEHEAPATPYGELIFNAARQRNVNPSLVAAIVRAESAFDPGAVSKKGARGLMQIMPSTGRQLGVTAEELFDAELNIDAGVNYLGQLIDRYPDDLPLILAAYNAGEAAVARYDGVPPFRETQDYIQRIYAFLGLSPVPPSAPGK